MEKLHLFLSISLFCALISLISISNYQAEVKWKEEKIILGKFQNKSLLEMDKGQEDDKNDKRKIVIWLNPRLGDAMEYRRNFVMEKIINPQNTGNDCFTEKYKCEMILEYDEKTLREADAIVFIEFAHYFEMNDLPPNWQSWRKPEQIWAIQIDESPIHHPPTLLEVFNWTLSYRQDSDIWLPYGKTVAKDNLNLNGEIIVSLKNDVSLEKWIKEKSKLVTGVISNCKTNSKRELILKEMFKTNISVDIYGKCGNVKNVKNVTEYCGFYDGKCTIYWNNLAKTYKFYLTFENSLCVDYITEKFWRTLKLGMVPVVYGGADYKKLAPQGSYIDVSWFKIGKELMGYLERVAGSEEEYSRFFEWKRYFDVREEQTRYMTKESDIWCKFCEKLRDLRDGKMEYKRVPGNWWSTFKGFSGTPCTAYEKLLNW